MTTSMRTYIPLLIAVLTSLTPLSSSALGAHWDSVGVFLRPTKVVVLINERGSHARLQQFMNLVHAQTDFDFLSEDSSLKISCGRNESFSTCTFRFLPSPQNQISAKSVETVIDSAKLNLSSDQIFQMQFKNSNGDQFLLEVADGRVHLLGQKK
jgi:hypothetical protein